MRKKIISAIMLAVLMNIFCIEGVQAEGANKENIDEKYYVIRRLYKTSSI